MIPAYNEARRLPATLAGWRDFLGALNVDNVEDLTRPVHDTVLANGIPLLENLTNLDRLPDHGARLTALPAPIRGLGSFPVRAVAALA